MPTKIRRSLRTRPVIVLIVFLLIILVIILLLMNLQCNRTADSAELFVNCLEAMVETCLPTEEYEATVNNETVSADSGKRAEDGPTDSTPRAKVCPTKSSLLKSRNYSEESPTTQENGAPVIRKE